MADALDEQLDKILRAAGSGLRHYTMQKTRDDMRSALVAAVDALTAQPSRSPSHGPAYPMCEVSAGSLVMLVRLAELRRAAENHQSFWDGHSGPDVPCIKITDPAVFAQEVANYINGEAEDGSTLLTRMLDAAIEEAVEQGCEGVDHG